MKNIALIVIDELQEIGDTTRGPGREITLTKIKTSPYCPQLIGLSAVLGNTEALARWLNADLLFDEKRPVDLYKGVLYDGTFRYKTYNTHEKREETLVHVDCPSGPASGSYEPTARREGEDNFEMLLANVVHLANQGEQILVFLPSKRDTMVFSRLLADRLNLPEPQGAMEELSLLEDTSIKEGLSYCLKESVAFHHADLSREERNVVESYARSEEIKVVCCTTTLALGVNLPATTVFLDTNKWEHDSGTDHLILTPISWAEYENISGRAGRLGYDMTFGRSITVARNDYEYQMLWDNYIEGQQEILTSRLKRRGFENHLVSIMASGLAKTREELETFLSHTYLCFLEGQSAISANLERSLQLLLKERLIEQDQKGEMNVSTLGNVVALKGITSLTAVELASFLKEVGDRQLTSLEILHAAASTDDGKRVFVQMANYEQRDRRYENLIREMFAGQEDYVGTLLSQAIKSPLLLTKNKARALKLAILLDRWISGKDTPSLETDFRSYYGTIAAAGEAMSWIVGAALLVAESIGSPKLLQKRLPSLSERLLYGVEEKGLELARLRVSGLGRAAIEKLAKEGLDTKKAIRETPLSVLVKLIPEKIAIKLKQAAEPDEEAGAKEATDQTTISDATFACQDRVEITGKPVHGRNLIMINGSPLGITNRSLEILLHLAVALKQDGGGWVYKVDLSNDLGAPQLVSRLRSEIRNHTLANDGKIIENDGSGSYRLSVSPDNVTIDKDSLLSHWNAVVRDLVQKV